MFNFIKVFDLFSFLFKYMYKEVFGRFLKFIGRKYFRVSILSFKYFLFIFFLEGGRNRLVFFRYISVLKFFMFLNYFVEM